MNRLTALREDKGWSKAELGRQAGTDGGSISRIEHGRIVPPENSITLRKLAAALGFPVETADRLLDEVQSKSLWEAWHQADQETKELFLEEIRNGVLK